MNREISADLTLYVGPESNELNISLTMVQLRAVIDTLGFKFTENGYSVYTDDALDAQWDKKHPKGEIEQKRR